MNYVFLFPGQGSQYFGMGKSIYHAFDYAKMMFDKASEILEYDLKNICFEDNDLLNKTEYTQPALFVYSIILDQFIKDLGYNPCAVAGHSLGEYSALVSANIISFEDALLLIKKRAIKMHEIGKVNPGKMAAIINANVKILDNILIKYKKDVIIANFNSDKQQIISGKSSSVDSFISDAKEAGIRRIIPLNVTGAFHSPSMNNARIYLEKFIKSTTFHDTKVPIYQNFCPKENFKAEKIKENLINQLDQPVKWNEIIKSMNKKGYRNFIEVGPKNILYKLNLEILPDANSLYTENLKELINFD